MRTQPTFQTISALMCSLVAWTNVTTVQHVWYVRFLPVDSCFFITTQGGRAMNRQSIFEMLILSINSYLLLADDEKRKQWSFLQALTIPKWLPNPATCRLVNEYPHLACLCGHIKHEFVRGQKGLRATARRNDEEEDLTERRTTSRYRLFNFRLRVNEKTPSQQKYG